MKIQSLLIGMLMISVVTTAHAQRSSGRDRAKEASQERESSKDKSERLKNAQVASQAGRADDANYDTFSALSTLSGGRADTIMINQAARSTYKIEIADRNGKSSRAVEVKVAELSEKLVKNMKNLKAVVTDNLSADQIHLLQAKTELGQQTIQLMTLASKRYSGNDADLVLARDAYARQLDTAVSMIAPDSIANATEVAQHREFVDAIVQVKEQNPTMTDAEATKIGVAKAYKESFVKRCQDGSCQVPSDKTLEAGARNRLRDLKDCT